MRVFFYAPQRSARRSKFFELIKMQSIEPQMEVTTLGLRMPEISAIEGRSALNPSSQN